MGSFPFSVSLPPLLIPPLSFLSLVLPPPLLLPLLLLQQLELLSWWVLLVSLVLVPLLSPSPSFSILLKFQKYFPEALTFAFLCLFLQTSCLLQQLTSWTLHPHHLPLSSFAQSLGTTSESLPHPLLHLSSWLHCSSMLECLVVSVDLPQEGGYLTHHVCL